VTTLDEVERWLDTLAASPGPVQSTSAFSPSKVLLHAAQSIELSLTGYPQLKPRIIQLTIGKLAFAIFQLAGSMRHDVTAPIPGAPDLPADRPLDEGIATLRRAVADFRAHQGPLAPHFLYGHLDRADYELAHSIHVADHARHLLVPTG
jgi:hypothetical protein